MNLSKLLSTKKRERILNDILFKESEISVVDISRNLNISKGFVSRYLSLLAEQKIAKKVKNKYTVFNNLNVRILKILFNLKGFSKFNFKRFPFVSGVGLYGSCAKGENTEDSDIDIWIRISTRDEEKLAKLTALMKRTSEKISLLYLTDEKLTVLKKEDPHFYNSLKYGTITIHGENIV
jgi:predicted nucleotidyltransferase/predicted transcriptional regulator